MSTTITFFFFFFKKEKKKKKKITKVKAKNSTPFPNSGAAPAI
jgi:hypothetical protein